jgi:hypothetical protein
MRWEETGMATEKITELESVKRLLMLLLLKLGATSEEIGAALDIDSSGVRKIFPIRSIKKIESIR